MNKLKLFTEKLPEFFKTFLDNELNRSKLNKFYSEDISSLYREVHLKASPIFILSPGRSGTKFLTEVFSSYKDTLVQHTNTPEFTFYSNFAFQNNDKTEVLSHIVDAARYEQIRNAFILGKTYIETNNRITFFSNALAQLYPNSKFIELKRDPIKFVRSGYSREWYKNHHIRDEGRIQSKDATYWSKLSQVEKIVFQWKKTHEFIQAFSATIHRDRFLSVNAEEMFKDEERLKEIIKFSLNENTTFKVPKMKKVNAQGKVKELSSQQIDQIKELLY